MAGRGRAWQGVHMAEVCVAGVCVAGVCMAGRVCMAWRHVWQEACVARGMHDGGAWQGRGA